MENSIRIIARITTKPRTEDEARSVFTDLIELTRRKIIQSYLWHMTQLNPLYLVSLMGWSNMLVKISIGSNRRTHIAPQHLL